MRFVLSVALVGLVVCVGCGRERKFSQEEAIAAIRALGGTSQFDKENKVVVLVDLQGTRVTDDGLVCLKGLANLKVLHLYATYEITDAGLAHLKGLTNLTYLNFSNANISDVGIAHLKGLTNLEQLILEYTKVTGAGVKKLQQALPNCDISR